ncbi:MAG: efflux RND transporter periplasmic adaptor subunit, partial [Alistipes sp.]
QEYENARSALKVFQASPEEVKLGEPLIVRAPIAGKVVQNNIVLGQYLKDDADPLAVVTDLSKVWVVAHVKEKDIRLIERLQTVDIRLSASPEEVIKGTVYHISEMLDEATRAAEVIVECDNSLGRMKPYMYGTVQLTDKPSKAILVPTTALLQEEEGSYVFTVAAKNNFQKKAVTVSATVGTQSVIASGLKAGDEVVTEGAFYLLDAK